MDLHFLDDVPGPTEDNNDQTKSYLISDTTSAILPGYRIPNNKKSIAKMKKFSSFDDLNEVSDSSNRVIKNKTGFYAQQVENYGVPIYYGPLDGPDFIIYKKQTEDKLASKNSLDNNSIDDVQKQTK